MSYSSADETTRGRVLLGVACCVLLAVPFLSTDIPPITDLPQQACQIRLLEETLQDREASPYKIQWYAPNSLSYVILGVCRALFGPWGAGRVAMLVIGLLWIAAIHMTASRRNRPSSAAVLASVFFFNQTVYWGFYSFAVGFPVFLIWFNLTAQDLTKPFSIGRFVSWVAVSMLLYAAHALWVFAGLVWLGVCLLITRVPPAGLIPRVASVVPVMVVTAVWYGSFASSTMAGRAVWLTSVLSGRASLTWVTDAALGGLQGPLEYAAGLVVVCWVAVGLVRNRNELAAVDMQLLGAAVLFFVGVVFLPDLYMQTIVFAGRWLPCATALLLLAVPSPFMRPAYGQIASLLVLAAVVGGTTSKWIEFERQELSGLTESLAALPENPRVLGLDTVQASSLIKGRPFMQIFAYSQLLKGGSTNQSFAEHASSLVVYREPFKKPWTPQLEWFPQNLKVSDLEHFHFALINAKPAVHRTFEQNPRFRAVTPKGSWRLYRIVSPEAHFHRKNGKARLEAGLGAGDAARVNGAPGRVSMCRRGFDGHSTVGGSAPHGTSGTLTCGDALLKDAY